MRALAQAVLRDDAQYLVGGFSKEFKSVDPVGVEGVTLLMMVRNVQQPERRSRAYAGNRKPPQTSFQDLKPGPTSVHGDSNAL